MPGRLDGWTILPGTGSPDGRTAGVVLRGTAEPPPAGGGLAGPPPYPVFMLPKSDSNPAQRLYEILERHAEVYPPVRPTGCGPSGRRS
jgi:hypothetical protein